MSHFPRSHFESYFGGDLDEATSGALLEHLGQCDECLDIAQSVWDAISPLREGWPEPGDDEAPDGSRLQERTLRRLHFSDLLADSLSFLIVGLGIVCEVLLRPLRKRERESKEPRRANR